MFFFQHYLFIYLFDSPAGKMSPRLRLQILESRRVTCYCFFFCFFGIGGAAVFTVVVVVVTHPQPLQHPGDIVPCSPSSPGSALQQCCSLMACGFSVRNISQRGFGFDGGDESVSPGSCRLEKSWGKKNNNKKKRRGG